MSIAGMSSVWNVCHLAELVPITVEYLAVPADSQILWRLHFRSASTGRRPSATIMPCSCSSDELRN